MRRGKGAVSSTVTTPGTLELCKPVAHMFLRRGISCGGGGMGCRNCLKMLVARMSPCLRLAPTVPAGSRVVRKCDPLLLRGNVRFAPIMCVPDTSDTIRCVLWTACSEYRLNPKPGTYATSINVIFSSVFPWKIPSMFPMYSTLILRRSPIVIVSRPGGEGLTLYILVLSYIIRHDAPLSAIQTSSSLLPDCTTNVLHR